MWIFPCLLFTLGLVITIIKLSLAAKLRNGMAVALAAAFLPLPFFPLTVRINMADITALLGDYGVLSTLCTIFIGEAIISMWLFVNLMKFDYLRENAGWKRILSIFPATGFLIGLVVIQVFLFNFMEGRTFWIIAGSYSAIVFFSVCLGMLFVRWIFRRGIFRLEALLVLLFFQLVLSMFLPMIIAGIEAPETHFQADLFSITVTAGCAFVLMSGGYLFSTILKKQP